MAQKRSRAAYEADLQTRQSPFVLYGTALPPVDPEIRDDGSYVPVWKQEVRDERGRKRLHGAFTGGFSAGYFNTVGSKEGWTPSTFVSSRAARKKDASQTAQQRPEDFMDEEDLADAAEAQRLQTTDSFAGLGSTDEEQARRGVLMDLLKSGGDTMGVQLLRKMGWREGQGVGPRVRRKARLDDEDRHEGEANETAHLFAPENPSMVTFTRKTDRKGLSYAGEARLSAQMDASSSKGEEEDGDDNHFGTSTAKQKKKAPRRGGLGVGILNDTGSDDEDPYEMGPRISYNRVIGDKKKKKKAEIGRPSLGAANPLLGSAPVFISKKAVAATSFRKCHDGRLPLEGFILSSDSDPLSSIVNQDGRYPPPKVPEDWVSSKQVSSPQGISTYQSAADAAKASRLDPKARASLLGEEQLKGKSVFDFLTQSARDRIVTASGKSNLPAALNEPAPAGYSLTEDEKQQELWKAIPKVDKAIAAQALSRSSAGGFMPYAEDEAKRARYRAFLEINAGLRADTLPERKPGLSHDDWIKELQEFAHAAQIFKPMSGMMASRFTSSSSSSTQAGTDSSSDAQPDSLLHKPAKPPEDPAEAAAKLGMFGPMTRSVQHFMPTRLLCKRFNVKPPAHVQPDSDSHPPASREASGAAGRNGADPMNPFQDAGFQTSSSPSTGLGPEPEARSKNSKLDLVSQTAIDELIREVGGTTASDAGGLKAKDAVVVDAERNEALEGERAGDAVFKAIFGSDDDDDDDDDGDGGD
ncbi:MAG: hypothetical protein M1819_000139 [Sarea resinae]|nr:MAG: hypothetical protein M1819_000139 [Sarea resinae]